MVSLISTEQVHQTTRLGRHQKIKSRSKLSILKFYFSVIFYTRALLPSRMWQHIKAAPKDKENKKTWRVQFSTVYTLESTCRKNDMSITTKVETKNKKRRILEEIHSLNFFNGMGKDKTSRDNIYGLFYSGVNLSFTQFSLEVRARIAQYQAAKLQKSHQLKAFVSLRYPSSLF